MKSVKKKIYSIILSLLVPGSFVSASSEFKAMDEDAVYMDEFDYDQQTETDYTDDTDDDEVNDEVDSVALSAWERGVDLVKNNPVESAVGIGGLLFVGLLAEELNDTFRDASDLKTNPYEPGNFLLRIAKKLKSDFKLGDNITIDVLKRLSYDKKLTLLVEMEHELTELMPDLRAETTNDPWCARKRQDVGINYRWFKDYIYYQTIKKSKNKMSDKIIDSVKRRYGINCYYSCVILHRAADILGLPNMIKINRHSHCELCVRKPFDGTSEYLPFWLILGSPYKNSKLEKGRRGHAALAGEQKLYNADVYITPGGQMGLLTTKRLLTPSATKEQILNEELTDIGAVIYNAIITNIQTKDPSKPDPDDTRKMILNSFLDTIYQNGYSSIEIPVPFKLEVDDRPKTAHYPLSLLHMLQTVMST